MTDVAQQSPKVFPAHRYPDLYDSFLRAVAGDESGAVMEHQPIANSNFELSRNGVLRLVTDGGRISSSLQISQCGDGGGRISTVTFPCKPPVGDLATAWRTVDQGGKITERTGSKEKEIEIGSRGAERILSHNTRILESAQRCALSFEAK